MSGGTTLGSQNLAQIDKLVKKAFVAGAKGYESTYQDIFIIETPERKDEKFTTVATDAIVGEVADGGAYPTKSIKEVGLNTISQKIFKTALPIGDFAEAFDNYGAIKRSANTEGFHYNFTIDKLCTAFLNNATSTTGEYGIDVNGTTTSLVATAQPIGDTGRTQSNRVSGNLSKTTLNAARVLMKKMEDHDGMKSVFRPKRLVVPTEEHMNAWELTMSGGEPESANNNRNYLNTWGIKLIENTLLTSSTGCFLMAEKSDMGARGLRLEAKIMPQVRRIQDPITGNWVYQFDMMLNAGVTDYVGIVSIGV